MKVLLIDDHEIDLLITRKHLEKHLVKADFIECLCFHEALSMLMDDTWPMPNLVITEIFVNNEECWDFLHYVPEERIRNTKLYVLTHCIHPNEWKKAQQSKVVKKLFYKPLSKVLAKEIIVS